MVFEKEQAIADEYFFEFEEGLGFTYSVSNRRLCYYISVKKGNKELEKFNKFFVGYKLADEGWEKFKYEIEPQAMWSEFDYEVMVYSKRVSFFYL